MLESLKNGVTMTGAVKFSQSTWQDQYLKSLDIQPSEPKPTSSFNVADFLFPWNEIDSHQLQNSFKERLSNQTETVRQILFENVPELKDLKNACLAFTGSDGRAEKLSPLSSPLELMFLAAKDVDEKILQKIQTVVATHSSLFHTKIEVKSIETHSLICFDRTYNWKSSNKDYRPFPTRALDASFLLGETSVFQDYKNKFHEEVEHPDSKKGSYHLKITPLNPPCN